MRRILLCLCIGLASLQSTNAQQVSLQFYLIDNATQEQIPDAHIFISDSSLGTTSDADGYCELSVPAQESQVLIVTHVLYETLIIGPERYLQLVNGDTLQLQSNSVDLSEILLTARRGSQWKRKYRRFKKALLGEDKAASNCEILNPEVLRFEEENGTLWVSAVDLLEIENDYLGYSIRFWLDELSIEEDGSTYFKGNGQFIDQAEADDTKLSKRRDRIYANSLQHFLRSLLESPDQATLAEFGYELTFDKYEEGAFSTIMVPVEPNSLVLPDTTEGWYRLYFSEFLSVRHNEIEAADDAVQINVSRLEQQRFGTNRTQALGTGRASEVSRLYKIEPYLLFDQRGNIINKSAVREYGYWANQRLAATLPIDYNAFSELARNEPAPEAVDTLQIFVDFLGYGERNKTEAVEFLDANWSPTYIAPLLDILRLSQDPWQREAIENLLDDHAAEMEADYFEGIQQLWQEAPNYGQFYADFKAYLYGALDPAFYYYFSDRASQASIRLDEIVWGGVRQDGIPPLRSPSMMLADYATYLSDSDVVFGLVVDGAARAYPKRILAWHEFFTDEIEGRSIAGVYCTLCGSVIIYDAEVDSVRYQLGTSGFLYRSNKLMYDQATQSLWSTILGQPVLGPLVGEGIELTSLPVETTTWGEWRSRHPDTQVLSLETGHDRNYDEGEAYKDYYANDDLMFPVPRLDDRLANKTRVFIPRAAGFEAQPLAIAVDYLKHKRIHHDEIGDQRILILSERNGASRAYAIEGEHFQSYRNGQLLDNSDQEWEVTEEALIGPEGERLARIPAHEVFWFAWVNVFPETRLVD